MAQPLIAIVNDDDIFLEVMQELLEAEGYRALTWCAGADALALVKRGRPALRSCDTCGP